MNQTTDSPIELGPVKAWSFSSLMKFESCPYSTYLQYVKKEPLPPTPEDPKTPWVRGQRIHDEAEKFIRGEGELTHDLRHQTECLEHLQEQFSQGNVQCEGPWGFTIDWQPTDFFGNDVWARMTLDVSEHVDQHTMRIIDWKSGKKFGNELKHIQQGQAYVIGTFMRYADVDLVEVEFRYTDLASNNLLGKQYTRNQFVKYLEKFNKRALAMTTAQDFPPKPSRQNCRFCDYGKENGTGACQFCHIL
jgi:hypothetical protein